MVENTAKDPEKQKPLGPTPTVDQIISDRITQVSIIFITSHVQNVLFPNFNVCFFSS